MSVKFDFDKYKESSKTYMLQVAKALSKQYYTGSNQPVNEGELIALDFIPSSGSLYCTELNTDIHLHDLHVWSKCGFDFDALSEFVSSSNYSNIEYIFSEGEVSINPGDYWVREASASAQRYNLGFDHQYLTPITCTGYNTNPKTFYVKNIPTSASATANREGNILNISRDKFKFREFMISQSLNYMTPYATSSLANNVNGNSLPDVVVKQIGVDNKRGLTFHTLTADNRDSLILSSREDSDPIVEQFMPPDLSDRKYPVTMRTTAMVYHQSINQSGSLWLRPSGSYWWWEYDNKYVESGSDQWSFKPSGVVGHFGAGTKVYMSDGSMVNIENVNSGSSVSSSYIGSDVVGKMAPTMAINSDDRIESLEPWKGYVTASLDSLVITSSLVNGITTFDCHTWVTINGSLEVSPGETLLVKSGSVYTFVNTPDITTDYKLISPNKSEIDITSVQLTSGSYKTFYGLDLSTQDIYFVSESLFVERHHTLGADNSE